MNFICFARLNQFLVDQRKFWVKPQKTEDDTDDIFIMKSCYLRNFMFIKSYFMQYTFLIEWGIFRWPQIECVKLTILMQCGAIFLVIKVKKDNTAYKQMLRGTSLKYTVKCIQRTRGSPASLAGLQNTWLHRNKE